MPDPTLVTLIIIAAVGNGVLLGFVVCDWARRISEVKAFTERKKEIDDNMTEIAKVHNGLATTVQTLQDKVNAHELRLVGAVPSKGAVRK